MQRHERVREVAPDALTPEFIQERNQAGWKLVALEWERPVQPGAPAIFDVPYGYKISADCRHLEDHPQEQEALLAMMDLIVADAPLSAVAAELNRRGFKTRSGQEWSPPAVFDLLPRLVETGPRMFLSDAWKTRQRAAAG